MFYLLKLRTDINKLKKKYLKVETIITDMFNKAIFK